MADEVNVNALVDEIADRVRRRLDALRAGTEEPCTASSHSLTTSSRVASGLSRVWSM